MAQGLLITNVRLIDPSVGIDDVRDLAAVDGKVTAVGKGLRAERNWRVVDGSGLWLWPGLVDVHVHFRDPGFTHKEDLASGSRSAAAGGYTTVVCEPNTEPPIDSPAAVKEVARRAQAAAVIRVYFKAALTRGREGREMADLGALSGEPNVVAFSDDGDPVVSKHLMERICRAARGLDLLLSPHCEDSPRALALFKEGADAGFEPGAPYSNESAYIERDLSIAQTCGCRVHFSHVSLRRSVHLLQGFHRFSGGERQVSFEVTPHHLLLSEEDFPAGGAPLVNPPLRSRRDRKALKEALASGVVDAVASDHAPHTAAEKEQGARGLIGLETTLGLMLTHFVHAGAISASRAVSLMSTAPARIFRLPAGSLKAGAPADMVLVDPQMDWTVAPEAFFSKSRNTPYAGWRLKGKAIATLVAAREVHTQKDFTERVLSQGNAG